MNRLDQRNDPDFKRGTYVSRYGVLNDIIIG